MLAKKNTYIDSAYQHFQVNNQDKQKRMEYDAEKRQFGTTVREYLKQSNGEKHELTN